MQRDPDPKDAKLTRRTVLGTAAAVTMAAHASATERLLRDPDAGFDLAVDEARRAVALGPDREETTTC